MTFAWLFACCWGLVLLILDDPIQFRFWNGSHGQLTVSTITMGADECVPEYVGEVFASGRGCCELRAASSFVACACYERHRARRPPVGVQGGPWHLSTAEHHAHNTRQPAEAEAPLLLVRPCPEQDSAGAFPFIAGHLLFVCGPPYIVISPKNKEKQPCTLFHCICRSGYILCGRSLQFWVHPNQQSDKLHATSSQALGLHTVWMAGCHNCLAGRQGWVCHGVMFVKQSSWRLKVLLTAGSG